jgi:hypothetical protein
MYSTLLALGCAAIATAHAGHEQKTIAGPHQSLWYNKLPGDGGTQVCLLQSPVNVQMINESLTR